MANPVESQNANFTYNSLLARALLNLIPVKEKLIIQLWLTKLHKMNENSDVMSIRNEYMWFMLLQLQNKRITAPFNMSPPTNQLKPLKDMLPSSVYEEVLMSNEQNSSWLEKMHEVNTSCQKDALPDPPTMPPALFLQNQPMPKHGVICYMAAFSDQDF